MPALPKPTVRPEPVEGLRAGSVEAFTGSAIESMRPIQPFDRPRTNGNFLDGPSSPWTGSGRTGVFWKCLAQGRR